MNMLDGTIYTGPFKNEQFHLKGSLKFLNTNVFTGLFDEGKCCKFGRMVYGDITDKRGEIYVGEMR